MVTTIKCVIHHLTELDTFCVVRILKIYSLNNFQVYRIILFIIVATLYITPPPKVIHFIIGSLYPLITFPHILSYPALEITNLL